MITFPDVRIPENFFELVGIKQSKSEANAMWRIGGSFCGRALTAVTHKLVQMCGAKLLL